MNTLFFVRCCFLYFVSFLLVFYLISLEPETPPTPSTHIQEQTPVASSNNNIGSGWNQLFRIL